MLSSSTLLSSCIMAEGSEPIAVTLTEDDIPGAKLSEPWERHTNHALRWWLLCHGIQVPVSLTKAKLIARFITKSCWFTNCVVI